MEAKELRFGNLINTPYGIYPVYGVSPDVVQVDIKGTIYDFNLDECQSLPLTKDWLLNFGFQYFSGQYIKNFGKGIRIVIEKSLNHYSFESTLIMTYFDHVHQLQNLCYALCGKELTLISSNTDKQK